MELRFVDAYSQLGFPGWCCAVKWIFLFKGILRAVTAPWGRTWTIAALVKCENDLSWVSHSVGLGHPGYSICCSWLCLLILEHLNLNLCVIFFSCSFFFFKFSSKVLLSILILVSVNLISLLQVPYIIAYHSVNVMICYVFILPEVYLPGTKQVCLILFIKPMSSWHKAKRH